MGMGVFFLPCLLSYCSYPVLWTREIRLCIWVGEQKKGEFFGRWGLVTSGLDWGYEEGGRLVAVGLVVRFVMLRAFEVGFSGAVLVRTRFINGMGGTGGVRSTTEW